MLGSSSVSNNVFVNIGGGAIKIGQPAESNQTVLSEFSSNDSIIGNRVDTTGVVVRDSDAVMILPGENNIISQNLITNAPHSGFSVGWFTYPDFTHGGNNRVELNQANHVMQLLNDGGGLYILGYQPGTIVERNVFHDVVATTADQPDNFIWGIYLDGTSNSMTVRNNLTYRIQDGGIMLNAASNGNGNNTVKNNIFVDGVKCQLYFTSYILTARRRTHFHRT